MTRTQALRAIGPLRDCCEDALLVYWTGIRADDLKFHAEALKRHFAQAADALGFDLVERKPAVTSEPGFDGRDGGRMNEISTAQEA